jgi:hypothetical protein
MRLQPRTPISISSITFLLFVPCIGIRPARAQSQDTRTQDIQKLEEKLQRLDQMMQEVKGEIRALKGEQQTPAESQKPSGQQPAVHAGTQAAEQAEHSENENPALTEPAMESSQEGEPELPATSSAEGHKTFGTYTPNFGFTVADTDQGSMNVSIFSYFRYLNQLNLSPTYTNAFGVTSPVQQRQDFQLAKVQIKFLGWVLSPNFRYFAYVWTSNANMGQGAQVVVAGNLNYTFNKHFTLSGGINGLPGTRTLEGNFPFWLSDDTRLLADEFFRPSYTSGVWARGLITKKLRYQFMLGNNLSTLGVNAGQLPKHLDTYSSALAWMPTTGEFGQGFGDFEHHDKLATRLGFHFTHSRENKLSQPGTEDFQNTQLRLSDGSIIFTRNLFGPGITITDATYNMTSFDGGVKLHGLALEGEYYLRWLNDFRGIGGAEKLHGLFDHGFQVQASAMVVPKAFQIYAGGSPIFGQFGNPWNARSGVNWFPWKNRIFRWNNEAIYLYRSPVGALALPFPVGAKGWVYHSNFEMAF